MKQAMIVLAAIATVAYAQCDWSAVDQTACQNTNQVVDCLPPGWPTCGGSNAGTSVLDGLPDSCNKVDFLQCFNEYPDIQNYLTCVHPEPCSCAGDYKLLECADAHCTNPDEYPARLTTNVNECRAKGITVTTRTTTQVIATTAVGAADPNRVSTCTQLIPSTTVTVQTSTTSTAFYTGAAMTMGADWGLGAMAAAAIGFAALL